MRAVVSLSLCAFLVACSGGGGGDAGMDSPPPCPRDDSGTAVTFGQVYSQILSIRCGTSTECHIHGEPPAGGLDMSDEPTARANLVMTASTTSGFCSPADVEYRVAPGNPDQSMLWRRVSGVTCAEQMPLGGPYLDCADQAMIRDWIASGANP